MMMTTHVYVQIGALFAVVCLIASAMFISSKAHYLFKMLLAAAVVGASVYSWTEAVAVLGYPVQGYPPDGATIINTYSANLNKDEKAIYFWVRQKDGLPGPRGYVVNYNENLKRQLEEAKEKARGNHGQMVMRHEKGGSSQPNGENGTQKGGAKNSGGNSGGGGRALGHQIGKSENPDRNKGGYGVASGFDGDAPVGVTIDVVPAIPDDKPPLDNY